MLGFEIGAHALRATAATNALDHQADIAKVQEWLGHANIATTRIYGHRWTRPDRTAPRSRHVVLSADMSDLDSPVSPMRFTKAEVLDIFRRQDATYRLAILASHWLRGATNYKPSAAEEARSLAMEAAGKRIPFSDLADELERDPGPIASEFVLNQLHASVRVPLEILTAYCLDHDRRTGHSALVPRLRATA